MESSKVPPEPENKETKLDLTDYSNKKNLQVSGFEALGTILEKTDFTLKKPENKITLIFRLLRETIILGGVIAGVGFVLYYCLNVLQSSTSSTDDKKWAQSTLTFIVGAGVGYLTGKNKKD